MSKRFFSDPLLPEEPQGPDFQMVWPQFQSKAYFSTSSLYMREMEERVLKQAKERSLLIEKEAYEKGYAQGEKDGLELGQKRIDTMIHHLESVLREMERQRKELHRLYEGEMLQLVISLSQKILRHELTVQEGVIQATLREALKDMVDQRKIIIHLHPADYQSLLSHPEGLPLTTDEGGGVKLVEDHSITRGGCLFETSFGETDATIEGQFDEIVSRIWEHWEQSRPKTDPSNP